MSKNLHLFGIGSAIVDIQLRIEHEDFERLNLSKGAMALVDAHTQRRLIEKFTHIPANKCSGGSAANTAIAFAQLGGKAGFGTMLGDDEHGAFYAAEFKELGIELIAPVLEGENTGTCLVFITPDAERTLNTSLAVNSNYAKDYVSEQAIARAEWLYFEGYKFTDEICAEAIDHAVFYAKKHNTRIAVSFSDTFVVNVFGEQLRKAVKQSDLVFCNQSEAQAFTGKEESVEIFRLLRDGVANVAMTLGERGSLVYFNGVEYHVPAAQATPVDTTGAGDMYAAGFLYGVTHGYSAEKAGALGSRAAAQVISQIGARLTNEEILSIRRIELPQS